MEIKACVAPTETATVTQVTKDGEDTKPSETTRRIWKA
jgi:hypothetical protein